MYFEEKTPTESKEGVWNEKTCIRRTAGWNIYTGNLGSMKWLPKGAVMAIMAVNGFLQAVLVKSGVVHATLSSGTSLKVKKGHSFIVGDKIGGTNTITDITPGADGDEYDTFTISSASFTAGDVILSITENNDQSVDVFEGVSKIGLNYAPVEIKGTPTCVITLQAYEIKEATLPWPVNAAIKKALTTRHDFI